jgi:hypothetical protein
MARYESCDVKLYAIHEETMERSVERSVMLDGEGKSFLEVSWMIED